jgi:hypothetical protein
VATYLHKTKRKPLRSLGEPWWPRDGAELKEHSHTILMLHDLVRDELIADVEVPLAEAFVD